MQPYLQQYLSQHGILRANNEEDMFIVERLIEIVAPHYCKGCGMEGSLVCAWCWPDFAPPLPGRCAFCRTATPESQVCRTCRRKTSLRHVWVRTSYDGPPKALLAGLKFERQRAAAVPIARFTGEALPFLHADTIVTHIPTITRHVRQRGYDHAQLIAASLAQAIDRPPRELLRRVGQQHQVGSSRQDRLTQLKDAFVVRGVSEVKGARVLLVDDVFTTGGTLMAAAKVLRDAGAKSVDAVVFAQKE